MAADNFFSRWAARKAGATQEPTAAVPLAPAPTPAPVSAEKSTPQTPVAESPPTLPTLADVDKLTQESDYSAFLADGVDDTVRRSAMKKLFTDPHFNIMDGLDIYISDYSQPDPIPAAMLAALNHGRALLDPLSQFEKPLMNLVNPVRTEDPAVAALSADDTTDAGVQEPALPNDPAEPDEQESPLEDTAADPAHGLAAVPESSAGPDQDSVPAQASPDKTDPAPAPTTTTFRADS